MDVSDIEESANIACLSLLPEKSKKRYEAAYKSFKNWCQSKTATAVSETLFLAYFHEKSALLKSPSSLWCEYSMLKSTLFIEENIDISKYPKLRAFLKRKNYGYRPKKSNVFNREDVNKFMLEAPDDMYLLMKVVMVMGVAGACHSNELCEMKMDNVKISQEVIIVTIPDSKNGMSRTFTMTKSDDTQVCHFKIIQKYIDTRSHMTTINPRFCMRYQNGKCLNQPVGKNTFSSIPSKIAKFLKFENFKMYTGHSFRRTSATLLANTGVDVLAIKRHDGWKSATIAESYVAESLNNKKEVANKILYNKTQPEVSCSASTVTEALVKNEGSVESENNYAFTSTIRTRNFRSLSPLCRVRTSMCAERSVSCPRVESGHVVDLTRPPKARVHILTKEFAQKHNNVKEIQWRENPKPKKEQVAKRYESGHFETLEQYELEAAKPRPAKNNDVIKAFTPKHDSSGFAHLQPSELRPYGSQDNLYSPSLIRRTNLLKYPRKFNRKKNVQELEGKSSSDMVTTGHRNYSTSPESRQLSTSKIYVAKEGHSTRDTTLTEKEFNKSQKSNEDSLKFFANVRQAGGTNLNILNHIPQYFKEPWAEPKKRLEFSPPIFQSNSNIEKPEIKFSTAEMRRQRREKENQNCERYYKSSYSDLVKLRLKELEKERLNLFNPATPESEAKKNICPWSFLKAPLKSNHQILQVPKNPPEQRSLTTRSKSNLSSKESSLATQTAISNSCLLTRNPIENSQDQRYYSKSKSKNKKNKRPKKLYERIDYNAGCDLCTPVIESLHHSDRRRIPLEPKRCESPKIVKKVYLPSNVKLGVSPCTIRPDYKHCKKEHKICPPRADECVVMATKKLPKLPTNNCPCIDPYIPHKAPKLEKLNLKFEDPPKQVCHVPMCETPRADDITPHKYKPLKPYVSGECECIQPPHMTDFTLKRLPKCEQEEICRPKRVCPVIEKCPPRADACLKLEPKQLPRIETSPCPCIDPHVPSLIPKLKRLNLTVPEPEKVCKTIFTCKDKERADDKIKLRKKKLPKFVPGDCPCEDKRMVDWNPKRLVCEEEARDCIVPDPCKEFPRADWGCWEYQDQICEAIDDKCIDDTVRCPPPPPPPKSRACHKHDPCKIHSGGIKEIRHLPKRKYSNSSASMKLYQQLKSHNVDDDVGCNKPSSKTYNPPKIKPSKSKNPKFVTSQKNLKITSKKFKSKSTLGLVKMLNDLENSKKTTEDPLLFKPIQDEKVNYEKILKQIASSTSVTLNKKEHKAGTLSPALKRSKSNTIKVASRAISTTKNVSRDENSLKQKRDIQGKKFLKNIKPTVKAMTCKKRCPNFALCKSPTREHRPGCRRERIPVCCEKEEPPYKAFTDNLEETIAPFTKTPQWTCNKMQFGYHPNYKKEHEPLDKMKKKDEKKSFSTCTVGPRCSSNSLGIVGVPTASRPTTAVGTRPVSNRSPLSVLKNPTKALLKKSSTSSIIITQNRTLSSKIFQLISSPPGKPKSNKKCLENAKDIPDRKKIGCIPLENESTFRPTYKKTYKRELNIVRKPPPFPAFSDCLDEEMEDILTECPLDKEKYLRMQPRFMNLTKPFSLKPPPPNQGKIDILKEQQCLRERLCIENEGVTQSCTDFGKPLPLLKIKKNQKNRDCEKVENLKKLGRWPPIRQTRGICSSTSALIAKSCRNLSTLGLNFIPEISKETSDTPGVKRLYIRNYHALIKGTDKAILGDNEAKLKEFTKKMFPDMDESTKLLKLRKNQWRIQNLKNYELLGPQRNVARCVKKFYCTYKTQRKYFLKRRLKGYTLKAYLGQRSGSNNATLLKHRSVCLRGTRLLKSERSKNTARKERSKSKPNKKEQQKFTLNNYSALQKKGGHRKSLEKFGHKHVSPFPAFSGRKKLARYTDLESLQPSYSIFSEHRAAPMQFPEQEKIDRSIGLEYYKCKHGLKNEGTTLDCQKLGFCGESKISGHCDSRIDSESSVSKLFVKEHKKIRRKAVDICNPSKAKARTGSSSKDQTKMSDNNECAKNRKKLKIGSSSKDHTKMNDNDECAKDIKKLQTICIDNCLKCIPSHLPEEEKYGVCKEECKNIFKKPNKLSSCDLRAPKNEDCEADIKKMCDCLRSTKNKKSEKVKVKDCLKATKNKKSEKVKSDCSLKSSSSTAMICPPAPCDPKRSKSITQLENLWQRIVNYFKARPNCPEPGEWKRRALREKAEKAAAAAGLIVLNPKCLPPEVLRKATVSTKDCKVCSNKDLCEKRDFDCETNKPASTKLNRRNFSTVIRQSRNFSRSVSSENLDEINKLLEKSELNKSKLSYSTSNTSLTKEFAIFPERKDAESSKALKLSLDRELYNNVDHKELYCKDEPYSRTYFGYSDILPSRENILERAWRISIESYNKCNYPRTYNFFNEFLNKMEKSIQSVEDLEKLKTENVLKELDEFLKNQDPDKNKK